MKKDLIEGEDYYLNENGYIIFTEKYHLKRGKCCKSKPNCKHCPFNKNSVFISGVCVKLDET